MNGFPPEDLMVWLEQHGFQRLPVVRLPSFGDAYVDLTRDRTTVRIIRDRGVIALAVSSDGRNWYDPELWRAVIDSSAAREIPFEGQGRVLMERLDDIMEATSKPELGRR